MKNEAKNIPLLNIPYFMEKNEGSPALRIYNEELVVIEFDFKNGKLSHQSPVPIEIDDIAILIVCNGQCNLQIDYIPHHLGRNTFILLRKKLIISSMTFSDDFVGYQILVKSAFIRTAMGNNVLPVREFFKNRAPLLSVIQVEEPDFRRLNGYVQQLAQCITLDSHRFQRSLVLNFLCNVIIELWNVIAALSPEELSQRRIPTMKEKLAFRFIHTLQTHCKKEHQVSYYAEELNVSTAHLTRVLKEVTGKGGSEWMNEVLLNEAKLLLHHPGNSIQSIASELHFSDQASFSKFFRKNAGISPLEYRNGLGMK